MILKTAEIITLSCCEALSTSSGPQLTSGTSLACTLSESSSGSAWLSLYRNDFGSRHSVCLVVKKYVPPTFSRIHFDAPTPVELLLSAGEWAKHLRRAELDVSELFSAIPLLVSSALGSARLCPSDWQEMFKQRQPRSPRFMQSRLLAPQPLLPNQSASAVRRLHKLLPRRRPPSFASPAAVSTSGTLISWSFSILRI